MFILRTMGELSVSDGDGNLLAEGKKPLAILAILARSQDYEAKRRRIADLMWPSSSWSRRRASFRQALYEIKTFGCNDLIQKRRGSLRLRPELVEVDLWAFDRAVDEGRFRDAQLLYQGPVLEGMARDLGRELQQWAEGENARIDVALDHCYELDADAAITAGRPDLAVEIARHLVRRNQFSSRVRGLLLEALAADNRILEARQEAQEYGTLLASETKEEPDPEFLELLSRLEREEPPARVERPHAELAIPEPPILARRSGHRLALALGIVAVAAFLFQSSRALRTPEVSLDLEVVLGGQVGNLRLTPREHSFEALDLPERVPLVRSADGGRIAFSRMGPNGQDLFLADQERNEVAVATGPAEELPLHWSPDGEQLLYFKGSMDEEAGRYRVALVVWRDGESLVEFEVAGFGYATKAIWSPDGSRIAVWAGTDELRVYNTWGEIEHRFVIPNGSQVTYASWSATGARLAVIGWTRLGRVAYLLGPDQDDVERIDELPGSPEWARWLTRRHLLVGSAFSDQWRLFLMDVERGDVGVMNRGPPRFAVQPWGNLGLEEVTLATLDNEILENPLPTPMPVDSVLLRGGQAVASPGEYLYYSAVAVDGTGNSLHLQPAINWRADGEVVAIVGPGAFRVLTVGEGIIEASLGGAQPTLERIQVRLPLRQPLTPSFVEDWTTRVEQRWIPFGAPRPKVVSGAGRYGGPAFSSQGDHTFLSGLVSKTGFRISDGITVQADIVSPVTGGPFQDWVIDIWPTDSIGSTVLDGWLPSVSAAIKLSSEEGGFAGALTGGSFILPMPEDPQEWHTYTVQINPEGEIALLIDGLVFHRSALDVLSFGDLVSLVIAGNTLGTDILVGDVTVYEGVLFDIW